MRECLWKQAAVSVAAIDVPNASFDFICNLSDYHCKTSMVPPLLTAAQVPWISHESSQPHHNGRTPSLVAGSSWKQDLYRKGLWCNPIPFQQSIHVWWREDPLWNPCNDLVEVFRRALRDYSHVGETNVWIPQKAWYSPVHESDTSTMFKLLSLVALYPQTPAPHCSRF